MVRGSLPRRQRPSQARIGAIGARPAAFNTVRYSEKLLEASGIDVETVDLSEILGRIGRMKDTDDRAQPKLAAIKTYVPTNGTPDESLMKMAKLAAVVEGWMEETDVTVSAVQCWTAMETYYGVVPCTVMSMMSDRLLPSACEVDVCGTVAMYALALASGTPSALLDWNNNYGPDPDKAVCFHCSNLPKHFFDDFPDGLPGDHRRNRRQAEHLRNVCRRVKAAPMTFARFSTDDAKGRIRGYVGEGHFTNDSLETFGGAGVVHIPTHAAPAALHLRERF